jgi:transposase
MARGPKPQSIELSVEDRETLTRWSRRRTSRHSIAQRSRIVLLAAEGLSNVDIGVRVGMNHTTVTKWRKRFAEGWRDSLADEPRPGRPRKITDDRVEEIVVKTLTSRPKRSTHWSTREMAAATGMTQRTIGRIWQAFGLKPWQQETFKISEDPLFIEKVMWLVCILTRRPRLL